MKPPFVDYNLYITSINSEIVPEDNLSSFESKDVVTLTKSRSSTIIGDFVGHMFSIYNGKDYKRLQIKQKMVGMKLGSFIFTKKLGTSIHNSERNAKKRAKMRRKITEKKIRRTQVKVKGKGNKKVTGPQKTKKPTKGKGKKR